MALSPGLLQGIQNPAQADILGQFRQGQERRQGREFNELAQAIFTNTPGFKIADLMKLNPGKATDFANSLGIPLNAEDRIKSAMGGAIMVDHLIQAGIDPNDVALLMKDQAGLIEQGGGDTTFMQRGIDAFSSGDEGRILEQGAAFNRLATSLKETSLTGKGTASQKDFKTFRRLTAKAERTGDPVDIEAAEQFGRQSGFDRITEQEKADIDIAKSTEIEAIKTQASLESAAGKAAIKKSGEFFDQIGKIREANLNVDEAIRLLSEEGAQTGPVISRFPSIRTSAVKLDNVRRKMGLDIIGAVTFGALSKGELDLALATAIPDTLPPAELIDWLGRRKDAQDKLSNYYEEAATFLGTPGNTIPKFLKQQKARKQIQDATPATAPAADESNAVEMVDAQGNRALVDPATGQVIREL